MEISAALKVADEIVRVERMALPPDSVVISSPRFGYSDVGQTFVAPDGKLWKVVAICTTPTVALEQIAADGSEIAGARRMGGAIGAPLFDGFRRLRGA